LSRRSKKEDHLFEKSARRQQDYKYRPAANHLYQKAWGENIQITRLGDPGWPKEWDILDKALGIDAFVKFENGMIGTIQEKFLSAKYSKYRSLTVAYQNSNTGNELSWFKLATQFYFIGYGKNDGSAEFSLWALINWPALLLATNAGHIIWYQNQSRTGYTASFRYCILDKLPSECIIASSMGLN